MNKFVENLPQKLRAETSAYIHDDLWHSITFFKAYQTEGKAFLAWMCLHLKRRLEPPESEIFHENDQVHEIFFLLSGEVYFVLSAKLEKFKYIEIDTGEHFGLIDIFSSLIFHDLVEINNWQFDNWIRHADKLTRQFNVSS